MQRPDTSRGRFIEICTQRPLVILISSLPSHDRITVILNYIGVWEYVFIDADLICYVYIFANFVHINFGVLDGKSIWLQTQSYLWQEAKTNRHIRCGVSPTP